MSIAINSNFERDQLIAAAAQTQFTFSFPIYADTFLTVYQYANGDTPDDPTQELVLGVDYTVTGAGQEAGGFITLVVPATAGDIITIVGTQPIERESVFQDLNPFTVAMNQQLNQLTIMTQQIYTYWANLTPHYNFDELVSAPQGFSNGVRPFKLILPMLPDGHVWIGRGQLGSIPDDITTAFLGGSGSGNVISTGTPMRQSIANWTGLGTQITDTNLNIVGTQMIPTTGQAADLVTGFGDDWGAFHWPAHDSTDRPIAPSDGDTYYDNVLNQFFGFVNGMWVPFSTGSGQGSTVQTIVTPVPHGLNPKDWVRVNDPGNGDFSYVKSLADGTPIQDADCIGVVIDVPTPTSFVLQQAGYSTGVFAGLTPGENYFLDTSIAGNMIPIDPTTNGQVSRPVFSADSATTGWVLPYRGLVVGSVAPGSGGGSTDTSIKTIIQIGHGFVKGDWIYTSADNVYSKGIATSLDTSQVEGVVINVIDPDTFQIQQSGFINGVVTQDDAAAAIVSANVYYLSETVAGQIQANIPTTAGMATKPVYVQHILAGNYGVILEQRPLIISASGGGTGQGPIIQSITITEQTQIIYALVANTWTDITALTAVITPTAATSTVKITVVLNAVEQGSSTNYRYRITKNGVPIANGLGTGVGTPCTTATQGPSLPTFQLPISFIVLDDNVTAIPSTYVVQVNFLGGTGSLFLNYSNTAAGGNLLISTITVEEIA